MAVGHREWNRLFADRFGREAETGDASPLHTSFLGLCCGRRFATVTPLWYCGSGTPLLPLCDKATTTSLFLSNMTSFSSMLRCVEGLFVWEVRRLRCVSGPAM